MKNVLTTKNSSTDSPKTPGGISRSLLTPCRRVGLSRNFKKSGASPFQSPLSTHSELKDEKVETRKRKEALEEILQTPETVDGSVTAGILLTPTRNVETPRRKKSKTLLASIYKNTEENELLTTTAIEVPLVNKNTDETPCRDTGDSLESTVNTTVSTPVRTKSLRVKSKSKKLISPSKPTTVTAKEENLSYNCTSLSTHHNKTNQVNDSQTKENSPNNLTKECIVVIQKKIFKNELKDTQKAHKSKEVSNYYKQESKETVSHAVSDSDTDDVPLICLSKNEVLKKPVVPKSIDEDNDFSTKTNISKPDNTNSCKTKSPVRKGNKKLAKVSVNVDIHKPPDSQSSVDDDDDCFEKKRTILIRKNYDKVMKPQKAKSTGSITQKDIDDLKAKIELKKKMLLAKAMTEDTKDLRDLIKKWQKGCQDALKELLDLMKDKFPDKQNMDYSEMLQTLKIPASLVGYDSDNDCFLTPDDESIILAQVKE